MAGTPGPDAPISLSMQRGGDDPISQTFCRAGSYSENATRYLPLGLNERRDHTISNRSDLRSCVGFVQSGRQAVIRLSFDSSTNNCPLGENASPYTLLLACSVAIFDRVFTCQISMRSGAPR